jgi:hypothetical protein
MGKSGSAFDSPTFKLYYSSFINHFSGVAAIVTCFLGAIAPDKFVALFPPLGDSESQGRASVFVCTLLVTYAAYFSKDFAISTIRRIRCGALLFGILLSCSHVALHMRFVRKLELPRESAVWVTVGYQRTPFAQSTFGDATDWELLRDRGFDEEEVNRLWTWRSLCIARLALLLTYFGVVASAMVMFSLGVLEELRTHRLSDG